MRGLKLHRIGVIQPNSIGAASSGGDGSSVIEFLAYTDGDNSYNDSMSSDLTATDASGNLYSGSNATLIGTRDMMLTKYTSSGTLEWRYSYPHSSGAAASGDNYGQRFSDIKCDSNGNIYMDVLQNHLVLLIG